MGFGLQGPGGVASALLEFLSAAGRRQPDPHPKLGVGAGLRPGSAGRGSRGCQVRIRAAAARAGGAVGPDSSRPGRASPLSRAATGGPGALGAPAGAASGRAPWTSLRRAGRGPGEFPRLPKPEGAAPGPWRPRGAGGGARSPRDPASPCRGLLREEVARTNRKRTEPDERGPRGSVRRVQSPKPVPGSISFKANRRLGLCPRVSPAPAGLGGAAWGRSCTGRPWRPAPFPPLSSCPGSLPCWLVSRGTPAVGEAGPGSAQQASALP